MKENKHTYSELEQDSLDKINIDVLFLKDQERIINYKIRKTPWYRIFTRLKLIKELDALNKEADKIGERLEKIEKNPIKIISKP